MALPAVPCRRERWKLSIVLAAFLGVLSLATQALSADKPKITTRDELPRHAYEVTATVTELVTSKEAFAPLARAVRADIESDLASYDIEDKTALQALHGTLLQLDLLAGNDDGASERIAVLKELEDKPAQKRMIGLAAGARIAAHKEVGPAGDLAALRAAYSRHLAEAVNALPWDLVQDGLQSFKGHQEMLSEGIVLGIIQEQLEPHVAKSGSLSNSTAAQVIGSHFAVHWVLPFKDETVKVLQEVIDRHQTVKEDIWQARAIDLTGTEGLHPVLVAIWDTGVDVEVFNGRVFTNPHETLDGKDNDENGHIDDLHGIAYDREGLPATGTLYPMDDAQRSVTELKGNMKGLFDLQAAVDSPEARALKQEMSGLAPDQVGPFMEDLGHYTCYSHGTHVAGIAIEGNPAASILVSRLTPDLRMIPDPPTIEMTKQVAAALQDAVNYYKAHGVRVVNMSWVIDRSSFEHDLELNGIGKDAAERKAMAGEMFEIVKSGLRDALASAPDILFVGGAGNSDNDITFDEFVPPAFTLPNLLIAGAVDQAGEATSFTSFGPTVRIYSNGFEVDSFVPGGDRMKLSGTSMSSPNVANLAAKLLAIDDTLPPPEVIKLILDGADERREGDQVLPIMNPKRSLELLRERQAKAEI